MLRSCIIMHLSGGGVQAPTNFYAPTIKLLTFYNESINSYKIEPAFKNERHSRFNPKWLLNAQHPKGSDQILADYGVRLKNGLLFSFSSHQTQDITS